ncbi:uncharacterized protein CTRU02_207673 [Colletotrichum truncatum]|uniref:Uncharacterized protein n=1 Tax=Colletotrichum truncatum TaxID=5467 RepID=A0ACC3Z1H1_COLTU|nr:uncharacterized protein CTRU02_09226 [Colletotrichum truncatum]KAF6788905.1 hypothetical protein CTRU02_09226 [Colletotrichum truncatum]
MENAFYGKGYIQILCSTINGVSNLHPVQVLFLGSRDLALGDTTAELHHRAWLANLTTGHQRRNRTRDASVERSFGPMNSRVRSLGLLPFIGQHLLFAVQISRFLEIGRELRRWWA